MAEFQKGDRVWFISKFGDRVTGTYEGDDMRPGINGDVSVHIVSSHDAFGKPSREATRCMVTKGKLYPEKTK